MINQLLLKQKLFEKSILENKILKAYYSNDEYMVHELNYDLMLLENQIKELENKGDKK